MVKEYQKTMLSLYIDLELKLAELYNTFADKFPQETSFFKARHEEELKHAQWIEYLKDKVEQDDVLFHEDSTRTYTLKAFLTHAQKVLDDAKENRLTLLTAISLAASMEDSYIERKAFEHFQADSTELQGVLKRLKKETEVHATELKKLRLKYSSPGGL
jgi:hypothetical protein